MMSEVMKYTRKMVNSQNEQYVGITIHEMQMRENRESVINQALKKAMGVYQEMVRQQSGTVSGNHNT
jgi:hypothetical protein